MSAKQSAEFYVHTADSQSLWEGDRYYVIRNGEMRICYNDAVIRYTDQLESAGITDDDTLEKLMDSEEFDVIDNPWFEVVDGQDPYDDGEVYYTLDEAVERAQHLEARNVLT